MSKSKNNAPHDTINGVPIIGPLNEHEYIDRAYIEECYRKASAGQNLPLWFEALKESPSE